MKAFEFEKLSKYRAELFGFSILSIVLEHFAKDLQDSGAAVSYVSAVFAKYYRNVIGSQGVDIFIFLSGMGLYFAMQKKSSMYDFYKKRLLRVLVPYLLSMPIFLFIMDFIVDKTKVYNYINHVTFGSFWLYSGKSYVWFIALILVLYIVFPFIYEMTNHQEHGFRNMLLMVIFWMGFIGCCKLGGYESYNKIELALVRVPVFIIGTYYGGKVYRKEKASRLELLGLLSGLIIVFLFFLNMFFVDLDLMPKTKFMIIVKNYFKFFFRQWSGIGLMIVMACIFEWLPKIILRFFAFFSGITLELYICHEIMRKVFKTLGFPIYRFWCYLTAMVIALGMAFLLNWLSGKVINKLSRPKITAKDGK